MCHTLKLTELYFPAFWLLPNTRRLRYNAPWKKWIVWDGKHWQMDDGYIIHDKGLKMIREIYAEQLNTSDYRDRMEIEKYAIQSESAMRRKAFVEAASWIPELNIKTDDLDKDPWLLNVENGTVNFRIREIREQQQEDLITKIVNVRFDPAAGCPEWKKFIRKIMN